MQLFDKYSALSLKLPSLYRSRPSSLIWQFWNAKLSMMCTDSGKRVVHTVMLIAQRLIRWDVEERRKTRTGRMGSFNLIILSLSKLPPFSIAMHTHTLFHRLLARSHSPPFSPLTLLSSYPAPPLRSSLLSRVRDCMVDRAYPEMPRPPQQRLPALLRERWEFILGCIRRSALGRIG